MMSLRRHTAAPGRQPAFGLTQIVSHTVVVGLLCLISFILLLPYKPFITEAVTLPGTCNYATTIKFGQSTSLTGGMSTIGINMQAGIVSAFQEANAAGGARGVNFELLTLDDGYETAPAVNNTQYLANRGDIFAIVGNMGTAMSVASVPVARAANLSFIGPYTGTMALRKPFQRDVINLRPSYVDEASAMVEYLVNVRGISRIALMLQNDSYGETGRDGVLLALGSNNLYLHSEGRYARNTANITAALAAIAGAPTVPQAIIVFGVLAPMKAFILEAKRLWKDCIFLAPSVVGLAFAQELLRDGGSEALRNVIITQIVPLPTDTSIPVVRRYQRVLFGSHPSYIPDFGSLEGYLLGRLIVEAFKRIPDNIATTESFLNAIYDSGNFYFDGLRCGPFLPAEVNSGCNGGLRSVYFTNLLPNATFISDPLQPRLDFSGCGYVPKQWTFIKFGQTIASSLAFSSGSGNSLYSISSRDSEGSGSGSSGNVSVSNDAGLTGIRLQQGILSAFKELNDLGGLRGVKLDLVVKEDGGDPAVAEQNALSFLNDASIFGVIGSPNAATSRAAASLLETREMTYVAAGTGDPSLHDRRHTHFINFRASLRDEVYVTVEYLYVVKKLRRFSVLYHESLHGQTGRDLVEEAVGSHRLALYSEGSFALTKENPFEAAFVNFSSTPHPPQVLFMFGPFSSLAAFVVEAKTEYFSSPYFVTVSETDPDSFADRLLAFGAGLDPTKLVENIIISQVLPPLVSSDGTTATSLRLADNFRSALTGLNPALSPSLMAFEGYIIGRMLISSTQRISTGYSNRANLYEAFYDMGVLNLAGIRCGPFELPLEEATASGVGSGSSSGSSNTAAVDNAGCNQCMKKIWLSQITPKGNISLFSAVPYPFEFTTCGFQPKPLFDFQLTSMRVIPVVLAVVMILSTLGIIGVLISHRGNVLIKGSWRFSVWTCFGGIMCYCLVFVFYPIPNDGLCLLQPWLGHLSFVIIFGPLFAKTRRTAIIFNNKKLAKISISDAQVMQFFGANLSVFVLYLAIWTAVDPPRMIEDLTYNGQRFERCASANAAFPWGIIALEGTTLLWGCFLCYRVQGIGGDLARFNESKKIGLAIYSTCSLGIILFIIFTLLQAVPNWQFLVLSGFLIFNTAVVINVMFLRTTLVLIKVLAPVATESTTKNSVNNAARVASTNVTLSTQDIGAVVQDPTISLRKPMLSLSAASVVPDGGR